MKTQNADSMGLLSSDQRLECQLLLVWASSLLTDSKMWAKWKEQMAKEQMVFGIERMLRFVVPFADPLSREMVQNLTRFAARNRLAADIPMLAQIKALSKYLRPTARGKEVDTEMDTVLSDRKEAE